MRHLLVFVAAAVLLVGGYFLLVPRTLVVEGRVVLRGLDGEETPVAGAKVAVYPSGVVEDALRRWRREHEGSRAEKGLELQAARKLWGEMTARRDEAARILRVAERANSADLAICRARYREAATDAEDALKRMEDLGAGSDEAVDPARFLAGLPSATNQWVTDATGTFRAVIPTGAEVVLVASLEEKQAAADTIVWLRRGRFDQGEKVQFSNANILTADQLAALARAEKGPGSPEGSPAD